MKRFLIALQFLTILPIKIKSKIKEKDSGASLIYFPIIGAFIGLLLVLILFAFDFLPHLVTAVLVLISSIIITGGIHLDGFTDTCDGFYGSKPKEKILEIMRDSRLGAMGAMGIVCILLLKFTLIASLAENILWKTLIMMAVFGRWSQVIACYTSNYARKEGKAKYFIEYNSKKEFLLGGFFTIALFLFLLKLKGIILLTLSLLPIFLFINYTKRRIGGMTGDTLGAINELTEVFVLLNMLILTRLYV